MIPSKEAGDYFNNNVFLLKYELDMEDPDDIAKRFSIMAFPTFVFVDGNGDEFTRFVGFSGDAQRFIERTQNAIKPENSWASKNAKLADDPSYTLEYIKDLNGVYLSEKANDLLNKYFESRTIEENFSKESIDLYNSMIRDTNSAIVDFMLHNSEEVSKVMGAEEFKSFLQFRGHSQLSYRLQRLDVEKQESLENLGNDIKKMNSTTWFTSAYTVFLAENLDNIKTKNIDALFDNIKKILADVGTSERSLLLTLHSMSPGLLKVDIDSEEQKQRSITLYEMAIKCEKDPKSLENYNRGLERLKNPPQSGGRAAPVAR